MSRRNQIQMSEAEVGDFVAAAKTIILNSIGPDGVPHPMPMWFAIDEDGSILMTTFRKSQKVRNLERDARVSLLAEDGDVYSELRGVVYYGKAELVPDVDRVVSILEKVNARNGMSGDAPPEAVRPFLEKTAQKRIGIRVSPERVVSWDHRKLGGTY